MMFTWLVVFVAIAPGQELVAAARAGENARVSALLAAGAPVDSQDEEGSTALMVAALRDDEQMIEALLSAGADPNLRNSRGETALLLTAGRSPGIVRALLASGAGVNLKDNEGQTPLIAAASSRPESVRLLLESGADVAQQDKTGVSALTVAEAAGATEIEALLREAGAVPSREDRLHEAIERGDEPAVRAIIREGADVNALDTDLFQTPLMSAVQNHRLEILVLLIEAGADPTIPATGWDNDGDNAILVAARDASPWALRTLLESKARPQDRDGALLAGCAHPSVIRVALETGARVNTKGPRGETPLMCAAAAGAVESVTTLLQAGADPRAKANDGSTALGRALLAGHAEVASALKRWLERP
ncbi:MAG: ankyrin repeat domain-containing protein [Vicinamibacteria bacterium]